MRACLAKNMDNHCYSVEFDISGGGLIESGAHSRFWLREEWLIREGCFIERGPNRAFKVGLAGKILCIVQSPDYFS